MNPYIEINLLPIEDRKFRKDYTFLLDSKVVLPTLVLILVMVGCLLKARFDEGKLLEQERIVAQLNTDIQNRMKVSRDIKKLDKILREKKAKNNSLQSIRFNKKLWVRILEGVNKSLPVNTWISNISQTRGNDEELKLHGSTHLFSEVALYMIELEKNAFFVSIDLESVRLKNSGSNTAFDFVLKVKLNLGLGASNPITMAGGPRS